MAKWQCPVCKSGKATIIGECLQCLGCGHEEYLYDYRNAFDEPMPALPEPQTELEDRIANLEAISAQPGRLPRAFFDSLQQVQGQVIALQNKLNAALDRGKERAKQQAAKQPKKPTYKGLNA